MYELYIQDTSGTFCLADLGTDLPAINIQRNDLGELKDRQTDYSQALKLPKTPTNVKIFSFVDEFSVSAPKVYSVDADYSTLPDIRNAYIACRLYIDGCTIVGTGGYLKITQITNSIEVQIVGGIAGFFTQLQENNSDGEQKTLNDLTFNDSSGNPIGIVRGLAGFQASTDPDNADVFFGIADFAQEVFTYNYAHYKNIMEYPYQYPVVKYKRIIEQILAENGGYTLETNLADNIKFKNACIPFSNIQQNKDLSDYSSFFQSISICHTYARWSRCGVGSFTAQTAGTYDFRLILSMTERHSDDSHRYYFTYTINSVNQTQIFNPSYTSDQYATDNRSFYLLDALTNDTDNSVELNLPITGVSSVDESTGKVTTINRFELSAGDVFSVWFMWEQDNTPKASKFMGTGLITNIKYGGTPQDAEIPLTGNLPAKTQYDFFKDFLQMYGLTVDVDEENRKIYAHTFDKVIENKATGKDWSQKYNKGSGDEKHILGSYVQTNYIKYADQTNDLDSETFTAISEDVAQYYFEKGKSVWYDNFYTNEEGTSVSGTKYQITGSFKTGQDEYYALSFLYKDTESPVIDRYPLTINNTTLSETSTDMITFLAETTKNILRTRADGQQYYYAKIKCLSSGDFPDAPPLKLLLFRTQGDCDCETITVADDDSSSDPTSCTPLGTVKLYALSSLLMAHTVDGVQYESLSIDAQSMVEEFYSAFQEHVLTDVRLIEDAEFYLTPKDIAEYDPFTPVYMDTFGAYFYINKIKNFVSGKLTKVDLVRI
jgi:hypothetical protein